MISIKPSSVPEYLKGSAFFANLGEDDEEVSVPKDCCKLDISVANAADLEELLRTLRFWGVDQIPNTVIRFMISNECAVWELVATSYVTDLPSVAQLVGVLKCKRERKVCEAALVRNLEIVTCLLEHECPGEYKFFSYKRAVDIAARNGDLDILKVLSVYNCPFHDNTSEEAALGGHVACLEFLIHNGCPVTDDLVHCAFASGSIECLRYVHETVGCKWTKALFSKLHLPLYDADTYNLPEEQQFINCLKYAQARGCLVDPRACENCVSYGYAQLLQYLHESGWPWDKWVLVRAAQQGHLICLKYAMEHGCPVPEQLMWEAMLSGKVDIIQYLHDRGVPWPADIFRPLYSKGLSSEDFLKNIKVCVSYAYQLGCPRDPYTCNVASRYGWLDLLVDAHEHGCSWDKFCTREAATNGHLDCLKYLHENGCPWDEDTILSGLRHVTYFDNFTEGVIHTRMVRRDKYYECLIYAVEHGCPLPAKGDNHWWPEDVELQQYLINKGCVPPPSSSSSFFL